jgi:tRNA G37 N-methylase TrmD
MTTVTGEIKVIKDYGVDGKHNWFTVINDADGQEHKAYSNANLSEFAKDDIVQVEGMTKSGKAGAYIAATKFMRIGEAMNQDPEPAVPAPPPTVSTPTHTLKAKPSSGLSKEEGMIVVGCWTRGITTRTKEEVRAYIDYALQDYRNRNEEARFENLESMKGGSNEPFNNQF